MTVLWRDGSEEVVFWLVVIALVIPDDYWLKTDDIIEGKVVEMVTSGDDKWWRDGGDERTLQLMTTVKRGNYDDVIVVLVNDGNC